MVLFSSFGAGYGGDEDLSHADVSGKTSKIDDVVDVAFGMVDMLVLVLAALLVFLLSLVLLELLELLVLGWWMAHFVVMNKRRWRGTQQICVRGEGGVTEAAVHVGREEGRGAEEGVYR